MNGELSLQYTELEDAAGGMTTMRLGAIGSPLYALSGAIGELLIFDHALSDTDRLTVEEYLMTKWSIEAP